jgi:PAS domain S-box-containing protein
MPATPRGNEGTWSILCLAGFSLLGIFLISVAWEFWLEQTIAPRLGFEGREESAREHWEYLVTSVVMAGIAMLLPTLACLRRAAEHQEIAGRLCQSEQKFRGIVENSPASISLKDADGRYLMVNKQFELMASVAGDEIRGKKSDEIFPEDFARSGMEHDREVLLSGQASAREEDLHIAGRDYCFLTTKFAIKDIKGRVAAIGAIHTDISERKQLELQTFDANERLEHKAHGLEDMMEYLVHARDRAETADHAKSEFLAMMSHELRTPLNAIIGFSEIMKMEALGPIGSAKYREFADDIHLSGRHLLDVINDILDLSKIESGKAGLCEENIVIPKLIRSALTLIGDNGKDSDVELDLECPDELPELRGDRRKLSQILVNLLSNGFKFTPAGGRITLRVWCSANDGHVFQIADTGIGIAPEDIPKALAPFQQIDSRISRKHEGTGLGLPLTKALVELHGGSLDLQSEVGVGTTVTVRFPAHRVLAPKLAIGRANAS